MDATKPAEPVFESWGELASRLATGQLDGWCFRGLSHYSYAPLSSLERVLKAGRVEPGNWAASESRAIGFFKDRARLYLRDLPDERDVLGWLTIMQHYGAPTRLLDWTSSPFIACYFAYETAQSADEDAALWMVNAGACRAPFGTPFPWGRDHLGTMKSETIHRDGTVSVSFPDRNVTSADVAAFENDLFRGLVGSGSDWPMPFAILKTDARMAAQQACFVCSGQLRGENPILERLLAVGAAGAVKIDVPEVPFRGASRGAGPPLSFSKSADGELQAESMFEIPGFLVRKIRLPAAWRREVLITLARMNITAETLYPGLDGAGRATRLHAEISAPSSIREALGL